MSLIEDLFVLIVEFSTFAFILLAVGVLALRFFKQPVERIRLIQVTLAAVFVAMLIGRSGWLPALELAWLPVEDDSGDPVRYFVELEYQVTADQWEAVDEWEQLADKQVEVEVNCGLFYRWRVRAQDGAGNYGEWSDWSHFSVSLG